MQEFADRGQENEKGQMLLPGEMECRLSAVILREKDLSKEAYKQLAGQVMRLCRLYNVTCMLHNFPDVALELQVENIHLPLPVLRQMPSHLRQQFQIIGASCHSVEEAEEAQRLGCSYITAGHVFPTDCKKGVPPKGLEFLKKVCSSVTIPVYAIGGINRNNIALIQEAGAKGACIMSGFMKYGNSVFDDEQLLLYAVTDQRWTGKKTLYWQVEQVLKGGATCIQLREKKLDEEAFIKEAKEIRSLCHSYHVPLIINDNLRVAMESGADGIHVGQEDCSVESIRKKMGSGFLIGATAKTIEQAVQAQIQGADYIGAGALFPSPTKEGAVRITTKQLQQICHSVTIPVVAIGGITYDNVTELAGSGITGVAVVSAVFSAEDIAAETVRLKERIQKLVKGTYKSVVTSQQKEEKL